ncbi:YigZ family protein [Clostridia bacterium]|nr:YigZ family protein [Clostridia bacterium]
MVETEDEAKTWIKEMKIKYKDATHNCSAYVVGIQKEHKFYDDNGEPHGTAGRPILGAIDSLDVTNVAIVVTRYFGGKKLGVRGLIDAYSQVARDALESSEITCLLVTSEIRILTDYKHVDRIHYLIKDNGAKILQEVFLADVEIQVSIAKNQAEPFVEQLRMFAKQANVI